jgi:hypothetical protein
MLVVALLALAGCGGGGGQVPANSAPATLSSPGVPVLSNTQLRFSILIPAGDSAASIVLRLTSVAPTNGATYSGALNIDTLVLLTGASSGCTATGNGAQTCQVTTSAPGPATDTFSVYSFATTTPIVGTTTPLSVYVGLALPVAVGVINTALVATSGVPASIAFSPASGQAAANFPLSGSSALITSLQVLDAGGATIIGGGNFVAADGSPANVTFTGCDAHLTAVPPNRVSINAIALGAATISIAFDGVSAAGTTLRCHATATGGLTATYLLDVTTGASGVGFGVSMNDRLTPERYLRRNDLDGIN